MSESIKILNNIRTLRAQAREFSLETLDEMLEKLTTVVEERRQEYVSYRKEREERQAKLEAFRLQLLEDGIDPADLLSGLSSSSKPKSNREPRPAK
ncbi:H-NS family nucleoid-associated regulatory protein, partial [Klebsiella quasipneumoniae]